MTTFRAAAVVAVISFLPAVSVRTAHAQTATPPPPVAPSASPPAAPNAQPPAPSNPPTGTAPGQSTALPNAPPAPPGQAPATDTSMVISSQTAAPQARGGGLEMEQFAAQTSDESRVLGAKARYSLNVFGDVGGGIVGGTRYSTTPSFGINNFSMLFTGNLENSLKFVAEASVEPDENNAIGIDLERLQLQYKAPIGIFIQAGRTHTPLGYWNDAYHHGSWLQPTITRPRAVRFEDSGGLLPIHWIGVALGWDARLGGFTSLMTSAAIGNGRGYQEDDLQLKYDVNAPKQGYAQIELKGVGLRDLRMGLSGVYGYISADPRRTDPEPLFEYIAAAHIAYPSTPVILIAEGYAISHAGQNRTWNTYDGFVLIGYTFAPITPYIQGEREVMLHGTGGPGPNYDPFYVIDPANPLVVDGHTTPTLTNMTGFDVAEGIAGFRWDVSTWCAIKAEYRLQRFLDQQMTTHVGYAAWQFGL
jgi:hypothetical protein